MPGVREMCACAVNGVRLELRPTTLHNCTCIKVPCGFISNLARNSRARSSSPEVGGRIRLRI